MTRPGKQVKLGRHGFARKQEWKLVGEGEGTLALELESASLDVALASDMRAELVKPNLTEINGLLGTSFTTRRRRCPALRSR